jgi:hypothetical protein
MYRRRRIYKNPLEKYNNKKTNTYLIMLTICSARGIMSTFGMISYGAA